jgi:enamine deaminase RidA (YjgF/YER057c/UK114 family)
LTIKGKAVDDTTSIKKFSTENYDVVVVSKAQIKKYYINSSLSGSDNPCDLIEDIYEYMINEQAQIISQEFFGSCNLYDKCMAKLEEIFGNIEWPVTWIEANGSEKEHVTGTQIYAVSGVPVTPVKINGKVVGNIFDNGDAAICTLGGVLPDNLDASNKEQTAQVFEKIEDALKVAGMDFSNIVRTWLYVNDILGWYDDFNEVRTKFFNERNVFEGLVPASTGIGVANPSSAALVAEVIAMKPKSDVVQIEEVGSPLQCSATDYKSSFSRAVEVKFSDHRRLYVSGTASIEPEGKTMYIGDVKKQIARTMEVVAAILESRGMDWSDASRAIAYFPDLSNSHLLDEYLKENSIPKLPIAIAHGDICRDDLLFEIEIDAVKTI